MADIAQIVDVSITTTPSAVTKEGFGIGLILAAHVAATPRYQVFASLSALGVVHGTTGAIYLAAAAYFAQSPAPKQVAVGRRQVNTCTITVDTAANSTDYTITINGTAFTVTSDSDATDAEIATALRAAINAGSEPVTASGTGADVILTADVSGTAFSAVFTGTNMSLGALTAAATIAADLAAIQLENANWYGVILTDRASADAQAAIDWVATVRKILFCASAEQNAADVADASDAATLPAILKSESQDRAAPIWLEDISSYPDAALAGRVLSKTPGTYTAMFKELVGISVSSLTETQEGNLLDKHCNIYEAIGGRNMVRRGTVASGSYIDQIHGRDWLVARIEEAVFDVLSAVDKVPFTDAGIALVENALKGVLQGAVNSGYLASYETAVPFAADVSAADKGNRLLPDVTFTAVEAGAIHGATINGVISI